MGTSVKLRTAVPSVADFGKSLGLSQKRQKSLISLVKRDSSAEQVITSRKGEGAIADTERSGKVSRDKR